MLTRELQRSGRLAQRTNSVEKALRLGKTEGRRGGDNRG